MKYINIKIYYVVEAYQNINHVVKHPEYDIIVNLIVWYKIPMYQLMVTVAELME